MNIIVGFRGVSLHHHNSRYPGEIYKNQDPKEYVDDEMLQLATWKRSYGLAKRKIPDEIEDYFKKVVKNQSSMSADSFAAEMFYILRYQDGLDVQTWMYPSMIVSEPQRNRNNKDFKFVVYDFLEDKKVDVSLVLTTRRTGSADTALMDNSELDYLIRLNSEKPKFIGLSSLFTTPFYIPEFLEGEKNAILLDMKGDKNMNPKDFEKKNIGTIPVSSPAANSRMEKIDVDFSNDKTALQVRRTTTLRGHMKEGFKSN
jgi:hypothetical protein